MYCGNQSDKVHLLNLSAIQLSTIDRLRLMQVLKRLIDAAKNQTFTGRQLYRILRQTVPSAIRNCYRTFFRSKITTFSLLNYGLNNEELFKNNPQLLSGNNKSLYDLANREFLIKSLNFMTGKRAEFNFANVATPAKPTGPMITIRPAAPKFYVPIRPAQPKPTKVPPSINIRPAKPTGPIPTTPTKPTTGTTGNNEQQNPENDNNIF